MPFALGPARLECLPDLRKRGISTEEVPGLAGGGLRIESGEGDSAGKRRMSSFNKIPKPRLAGVRKGIALAEDHEPRQFPQVWTENHVKPIGYHPAHFGPSPLPASSPGDRLDRVSPLN
jgi:hypothetical protein